MLKRCWVKNMVRGRYSESCCKGERAMRVNRAVVGSIVRVEWWCGTGMRVVVEVIDGCRGEQHCVGVFVVCA